ncbi:MAG: hypothetical protein QTN59_13100 [Candidatus Electrothrix communis]|nr:MAG: hypothetical protein QTN59_13100 [Candidatus Electrothrix communis]
MDVQVWLGAKKHPTKGNRIDLTLPLGRYRLLAKKPGFKPVRQDIFLTADEEIGIRLEEIYTLTVYADMEESRVMLDGNIVGTAGNTSPLEFSLIKGEYDLILTNHAVSTHFQKKFCCMEIKSSKPNSRTLNSLSAPMLTIRQSKSRKKNIKPKERSLN